MRVDHQFLHEDFFFPNWEVNKLFLGTFNPACGQELDYYYRRIANGFWRILKHYDPDNVYDFREFDQLKNFMRHHHFGCVDVVGSVEFPDHRHNEICGSGYEDSKLFRVQGFLRDYNFVQIKQFIEEHHVTGVFTTWGARSAPVEFVELKEDLRLFCEARGLMYVPLKSPSGRLYRGASIERINKAWWDILDPIF